MDENGISTLERFTAACGEFRASMERYRAWKANYEALDALRDALAMPGATVPEMCERIRTLRQTEMLAREAQSLRLGWKARSAGAVA